MPIELETRPAIEVELIIETDKPGMSTVCGAGNGRDMNLDVIDRELVRLNEG
ncbi:MAG: hypothetical protein ABW046_11710 [Actinoplanes sp.]